MTQLVITVPFIMDVNCYFSEREVLPLSMLFNYKEATLCKMSSAIYFIKRRKPIPLEGIFYLNFRALSEL